MYVVDDETFRRTRSIVASLADALAAPVDAGTVPTDLRALVRRTAVDLPVGGEAAWVADLRDALGRLFPIEEMFPRKRRSGRA